MNNKVLIAMSGGVDSSVAAAVLLEQGYEVIGATMQIWQDESEDLRIREGGCCSLSAVDDARRVANKLSIPYYVLNFKDIFEKNVIDYFTNEYLSGSTPNPCILCNRIVKFEALLKKAISMGIDRIATGHYAKIEKDPVSSRYLLIRSANNIKDQTYALYNMTQYQLERTLFPIGDFDKDKVREKAKELGLSSVANKPDSQEICFVTDNNYAKFITERVGVDTVKPGNFVDLEGNVLGQHKGIVNYTVGQRRGLGISFGKHMYVVRIDAEKNEVVLGDDSDVFSDALIAEDLNFIPFDKLEGPIDVTAKIRYSSKEAPCTVIPVDNSRVKVIFKEPQRAITPGQSVVFYMDDIVVGGGKIVKNNLGGML